LQKRQRDKISSFSPDRIQNEIETVVVLCLWPSATVVSCSSTRSTPQAPLSPATFWHRAPPSPGSPAAERPQFPACLLAYPTSYRRRPPASSAAAASLSASPAVAPHKAWCRHPATPAPPPWIRILPSSSSPSSASVGADCRGPRSVASGKAGVGEGRHRAWKVAAAASPGIIQRACSFGQSGIRVLKLTNQHLSA
jgi:hypothetical protein